MVERVTPCAPRSQYHRGFVPPINGAHGVARPAAKGGLPNDFEGKKRGLATGKAAFVKFPAVIDRRYIA